MISPRWSDQRRLHAISNESAVDTWRFATSTRPRIAGRRTGWWKGSGAHAPGRSNARKIAARIDPWTYRATEGRLHSTAWTIPSAPLLTTGAKSGRPHEVQLVYFHDGSSPVLVASNFGGAKHPHWYHNLIAHPDCRLGGEPFVAAEVTEADEYGACSRSQSNSSADTATIAPRLCRSDVASRSCDSSLTRHKQVPCSSLTALRR
ncbi:nitroreductase/quinone reductase family protein [Rhodococcus sp. NPDC058521]|uniref:nitroreductase/quinone reductase family protein n=1 Tax=Rhodococcus sp. NPDC058521 TaxID=3346536 RepID=UPI003655D591